MERSTPATCGRRYKRYGSGKNTHMPPCSRQGRHQSQSPPAETDDTRCNRIPNRRGFTESSRRPFRRDTEEFSNGLTPEEFFHAYCFFVFDLKGGLGKDLLDVKTKANVRLEVTYKKGVNKDLAVVVHGIFPDTFSIDSSRNVYPSAML